MHYLARLSATALLTLAAIPVQAGEPGSFTEPLPLPANMPIVHGGCDVEAKAPALADNGSYRCDGVPFSIRLPVRDSIQQIYGNNYVSLQHVSNDGILLVSFTSAIAELDRRYRDTYRATLATYPARLLRSVGVERVDVGQLQQLSIPGADYAIEMPVTTGPVQRPIEGTARVLLSRGWMVFLMVAGSKDQRLHRDRKKAKRFINSFRALDDAPGWQRHRYPEGGSVAIPGDGWAMKAPAGKAHYLVQSLGGMLRMESAQRPDCDGMDEAQRLKLAGDIAAQQTDERTRFVRSRWYTMNGSKILMVEAESRSEADVRENGPFRPAVVVDACVKGAIYRVFLMSYSKPLRHLADMAEQFAATFAPAR